MGRASLSLSTYNSSKLESQNHRFHNQSSIVGKIKAFTNSTLGKSLVRLFTGCVKENIMEGVGSTIGSILACVVTPFFLPSSLAVGSYIYDIVLLVQSVIGSVLGGYAGMRLTTGTSEKLVDIDDFKNSYIVKSLQSMGAGGVIDTILPLSTSIPCIAIRKIFDQCIEALSFNAFDILGTIRDIKSGHALDDLLPKTFMIKSVANKIFGSIATCATKDKTRKFLEKVSEKVRIACETLHKNNGENVIVRSLNKHIKAMKEWNFVKIDPQNCQFVDSFVEVLHKEISTLECELIGFSASDSNDYLKTFIISCLSIATNDQSAKNFLQKSEVSEPELEEHELREFYRNIAEVIINRYLSLLPRPIYSLLNQTIDRQLSNSVLKTESS